MKINTGHYIWNPETLEYENFKIPNTKITSLSTEEKIKLVIEDLKDLLLEKNRKYGDSALSPVRIFSKSDNLEQLRVRIDDKLSRIVSAQLDDDEEVINDLLGYLILYRVAML